MVPATFVPVEDMTSQVYLGTGSFYLEVEVLDVSRFMVVEKLRFVCLVDVFVVGFVVTIDALHSSRHGTSLARISSSSDLV